MPKQQRVGWFGKTWIAGVFAFSVIRALAVWPTLSEYSVSPWLFLVIDVITAWPYAYGQVRIVKDARVGDWRNVQKWAVITFVMFIAPYAYIVGAGSGEMPLLAWIIIVLLVTFFGVASVIRTVRQIRAPAATDPAPS